MKKLASMMLALGLIVPMTALVGCNQSPQEEIQDEQQDVQEEQQDVQEEQLDVEEAKKDAAAENTGTQPNGNAEQQSEAP